MEGHIQSRLLNLKQLLYLHCIYGEIALAKEWYENPQVRRSELGVTYQNCVFRRSLERCHRKILSKYFLDEKVHLHIHGVDLLLS